MVYGEGGGVRGREGACGASGGVWGGGVGLGIDGFGLCIVIRSLDGSVLKIYKSFCQEFYTVI